MATSFSSWRTLDSLVCSNANHAHISAVVYAALNAHVISMKLLMEGLLIPSGSSERYALESMALGLLISQPSQGVLLRFTKGKYQTSRAIGEALAKASQLNLSTEEIQELAQARKFYHYASHPSLESLGSVMSVNSNGQPVLLLGGIFDDPKMDVYHKEIESRVSLAGILPVFIDHIQRLYQADIGTALQINPAPSSSPISSSAWRA